MTLARKGAACGSGYQPNARVTGPGAVPGFTRAAFPPAFLHAQRLPPRDQARRTCHGLPFRYPWGWDQGLGA